MKKSFIVVAHIAALCMLAGSVFAEDPASNAVIAENPACYGGAGLNASERAGCDIWTLATAGNDRFHTYTFLQRVGVLIDWYRVLNAPERNDRFAAWGIINDPGCCKPGDKNCPAKNLDETYGFDYCPGDDELLKFVGKTGYRDPACDFKDAPADASDPHHKTKDQRQSACDLAFGTSTGALGLRKFPNPRFNKERWLKLNGTLSSWEGFRSRLSPAKDSPDSRVSHLADGSVEPPFLIGMACGVCHIAFDPLNPPRDPAHPAVENIKAAIGNQYSRISEILGSGQPHESIEYQIFAHARPGTSDTSAVTNDQVSNPGTMNAIINFPKRPTFSGEQILKWRKVSACEKEEPESDCWCEPARDGKCWRKSSKQEVAHHILKGGEDSIGILEAVQRVYFNIGSCSETCFQNHLMDMRVLDPQARNFGQTPFNIGQCRRDCPNFRAIEDRLPDIGAFLLSKANSPTDLQVARENERKKKNKDAKYSYQDLVSDLEKQFGQNAVAKGRHIFALQCAKCHSSLPESTHGPFENRDFRKVDMQVGTREDWMGNDQSTKATEVGTFRCRALHSNHMTGHLWQEYGSETMHARAPDPNIKEAHDGGRSYYRNISLLSVWAQAPLLHNNSVGPEVCGKPQNKSNFFYRSPYVDKEKKPIEGPACWEYDPSVEGRFKLFVASLQELLTPEEQRLAKITRFDVDVPIPLGLRVKDGDQEKQLFGLTVTIPQGTSSTALGSFQHKALVGDLLLASTKPEALDAKFVKQYGDNEGKALAAEVRALGVAMAKEPAKFLDTIKQHPRIMEAYSSCTADVENIGHKFGTDLSDAEKKALIAFLATL